HLIRGGLTYNMELRWDGVPSLADALRMLKEQVARTPAPQWVRVIGGWGEFQFAERRMPTLEEINAIAPDTPVFILHLYDRALLNAAALRAVGYTKEAPNFPGGRLEFDGKGNPTGLILAEPNAIILYSTLAQGPKLPVEDQMNSSRQFMRELNRLGVTSVIDAGGGFQNYPEDYQVMNALHQRNQMTVRIAYNLFTQRPKHEQDDFMQWVKQTQPGDGDDYYKVNGAGEMLVFSATDFEDFLQPRPEMSQELEPELERVVRILAGNRWPFRIHATYDETIERDLNVFEKVNKDIPFEGLHWFIDHAETISPRNIERIRALGGGIAIQNRMAFQGEYFINRYGKEAAKQTPPIQQMLDIGLPVGAGTDATRVSSYNPFVSLYWLISGKTVGGTALYDKDNLCSRIEALSLYTKGSAWFSGDEKQKGSIEPGMLADLAVLSGNYLTLPEEEIKGLESVLTIVDGKIVYGTGDYKSLDLPELPVSPTWSPVKYYGGYFKAKAPALATPHPHSVHNTSHYCHDHSLHLTISNPFDFWGARGCFC
ncbi:MAG: amidohydrolase, partial [Cyanobacteria bacterium]|nr:amidohydrolase [Cyanobacteriota bacterium]